MAQPLSLLEETSSSDLWSQGYIAWFPIWGLQTPGGMASSAFSLLRIFLEIIKGKLPLGGHRSGEYAAWPGNSFMQRKCPPFFRADAVPGRSLSDHRAGWIPAALAPQHQHCTACQAPTLHGGPGSVAGYECMLETTGLGWCIFPKIDVA